MAHDRFRVSYVQIPGFFEYFRLVDGHSHVLAKMFSPRGYQVFQMEQAGPIAKRDARFANVRSVNTPNGAQITFNFKESVPAYRVRLRRDYVEFLISAESKSAKAAPAKTKAAVAKPAKKH